MTSNCRSGKRLRQRMMMIMLLQVGFLRHCCTMQFYALASLASPASLLFAGGSGCGWRPMGLLLCKAPFSYYHCKIIIIILSLSLPPLTTTIVRKNWSKEWIMKRGEEDKKKGYKNSLWILCFWDEIKIPAAASLFKGRNKKKVHISIHPRTKWLAITGIQWINGRKTSCTKLPGELHKQTQILQLALFVRPSVRQSFNMQGIRSKNKRCRRSPFRGSVVVAACNSSSSSSSNGWMKYNLVDVEIGFELLSNYSSFRELQEEEEEKRDGWRRRPQCIASCNYTVMQQEEGWRWKITDDGGRWWKVKTNLLWRTQHLYLLCELHERVHWVMDEAGRQCPREEEETTWSRRRPILGHTQSIDLLLSVRSPQ